MKKSVILVLILFSFVSFVSATDCAVKTSCNPETEINILDVSSVSNAHVSAENINYMQLCCPNNLISSSSVATTCSQTNPLNLYSLDNTHIAIPPSTIYLNKLCIDSNVQCQTSLLPCSNLGTDYFCLLKYKEETGFTDTNAHAADCSDTFYSKSICCSVAGGECLEHGEDPCTSNEDCCQGLTCSGNPLENQGCCYENEEWVENPLIPGNWYCQETGSCAPPWTPENQGSYTPGDDQVCCDGYLRTIYTL